MIHTATAPFRAELPDGGVLLGLDPGTRTIGLALCDAGWRFASPATTIIRRKFRDDKAAIAATVAARAVRGLVIGLPLNMDGSDSPRAQAARAMARNLADLGLPTLMWDERWSTVAAERAMIAQDMSRARRAERIDAHAAAIILQGAIDALSAGGF
jgi:putative Holliday junction resolvase